MSHAQKMDANYDHFRDKLTPYNGMVQLSSNNILFRETLLLLLSVLTIRKILHYHQESTAAQYFNFPNAHKVNRFKNRC